ncbi:MAG: hypothetical protein IT222_09175 [Crocinitomix sp.]|nr:hypothetical protein [Crocinitomix sp.]
MTKSTLILLIVLALVSCKKKTFITIQAENYITGEGSAYAGAQYIVVESYTPFFEVKSKQVANGILDANGHAAFEIKADRNKKYNMSISMPTNVCYTAFSNYQSLEEGEDNVFNFKYGTCGYVKMSSDNVNCIDETDKFHFTYYTSPDRKIYINRSYILGEAENYSWNSQVASALGCISKSWPILQVPVGSYVLDWRVIRGTDTTLGTDTFYVNENDTTTYLIEY